MLFSPVGEILLKKNDLTSMDDHSGSPQLGYVEDILQDNGDIEAITSEKEAEIDIEPTVRLCLLF